MVNSEQGRRGWLREGRHQLDELRRQQARPIARSRTERLEESKRRLEEEHRVELEANAAYEAYKARGVMRDGRRFGKPPKPYVPPAVPTGTINTTDHDSRIVRTTGQPARQGYNAQAAVNEHQIIIAAEVTVDSPDFGHLEPMVDATQRELEAIGVSSLPETVVADPGYWHKQQMENVVSRGIQVLDPARLRVTHRTAAGMEQGPLRVHALGAFNRSRPGGLPKTDGHRRARVRPGQVQPRVRPLPPTRTICRALGVAISSSDPQPPEAPHAPDRRHRGLKTPRRQPIRADTANPAPRASAPTTPPQTICPTATRNAIVAPRPGSAEPGGAISQDRASTRSSFRGRAGLPTGYSPAVELGEAAGLASGETQGSSGLLMTSASSLIWAQTTAQAHPPCPSPKPAPAPRGAESPICIGNPAVRD